MAITRKQVEELRELYTNATQGRWYVSQCLDGIYAGKDCLVSSERKEIMGVRQIARPQHHDKVEENARLVVAMQNLLPEILDILEGFMVDGADCTWIVRKRNEDRMISF